MQQTEELLIGNLHSHLQLLKYPSQRAGGKTRRADMAST
jgi:hypothetical protein